MRFFKVCSTASLMLAGAVGIARAEIITFDLNHPDSRGGVLSNTYARQYNYVEDDLSLALTGWSYGTRTDSYDVCVRMHKGKCKDWDTVETTSVVESIEQTYVGKWDGLGVEKGDSPNHGVDNEDGDYDMHLLSFDEMVKLTSLNLGWQQSDSDISILAFVGTVFDSSSLLGKKWQDLVGEGWSVVGNYYNVDHAGNSGAVNLDGLFSQYWLVGAYNTNFGSVFSGPNVNKSSGDDFYKLKGLSVERQPAPLAVPEQVQDVPEPAAAVLLGLALAGLAIRRRRQH